MKKESSRTFGLDIAKTFAAMIVIFHHFQLETGTRFSHGINFDNSGNFAFGSIVELFFFISGYVTYKSIQHIDSTWDMASFFKKSIVVSFHLCC